MRCDGVYPCSRCTRLCQGAQCAPMGKAQRAPQPQLAAAARAGTAAPSPAIALAVVAVAAHVIKSKLPSLKEVRLCFICERFRPSDKLELSTRAPMLHASDALTMQCSQARGTADCETRSIREVAAPLPSNSRETAPASFEELLQPAEPDAAEPEAPAAAATAAAAVAPSAAPLSAEWATRSPRAEEPNHVDFGSDGTESPGELMDFDANSNMSATAWPPVLGAADTSVGGDAGLGDVGLDEEVHGPRRNQQRSTSPVAETPEAPALSQQGSAQGSERTVTPSGSSSAGTLVHGQRRAASPFLLTHGHHNPQQPFEFEHLAEFDAWLWRP